MTGEELLEELRAKTKKQRALPVRVVVSGAAPVELVTFGITDDAEIRLELERRKKKPKK